MSDNSNSEGSAPRTEEDESAFSDLLAQITKSESEREPQASTVESEEQPWTERIEDVEKSVEEVRQLFVERFDQLEPNPTPEFDGNTPIRTTKWIVVGLMLLTITIGGVILVAP
jgi:hypothetical protein